MLGVEQPVPTAQCIAPCGLPLKLIGEVSEIGVRKSLSCTGAVWIYGCFIVIKPRRAELISKVDLPLAPLTSCGKAKPLASALRS